MIRLALITLAVLLGRPAMGFSQDTVRTSADSVAVDSTAGKRAMPVNAELPDSAKVTIEESKIFDPSTFPPSLGEREAIEADLRKPPKPRTSFAETPEPMRGTIKVGYGMYVSPMINGWVGTNTPTTDITLRGGFASTQGHAPNRDTRSGNAQLTGGLFFSENAGMFANGRLESSASIAHDKYRLYGSTTPDRERTLNTLAGSVSISAFYSDGGYLKAKANLEHSSLDDSVRMKEIILGAEVGFGVRMGVFSLDGTTNVSYNFYTTSIPTSDPTFAEGRLTLHYRPSERLDLYVIGVGYDFRGTSFPKRRWVGSGGGIVWNASNSLALFAEYKPYVQQNTLSKFARQNPFLDYRIHIEHTEFLDNAVAGFEVRARESFVGKISMAYQEAYRYPVFWHRRENLWSVEYDFPWIARVLSFQSELHAELGENVTTGFTLSYRKVRDRMYNWTIPYLPSLTMSALYRQKLSRKVFVESDVQYFSSRLPQFSAGQALRPLTFWNATFGYNFSQRVSMSVTIENILDQQRGYWEGYASQPRRGSLSIELIW
ncbi:MAG: TonB-dependent receptor [Ignavibacteriae bacterium]|nr:TonB-dependent receptor [Ignavibacteriota bacterium]